MVTLIILLVVVSLFFVFSITYFLFIRNAGKENTQSDYLMAVASTFCLFFTDVLLSVYTSLGMREELLGSLFPFIIVIHFVGFILGGIAFLLFIYKYFCIFMDKLKKWSVS